MTTTEERLQPESTSCGCFFAGCDWHDPLLAMEGNAAIIGYLRSDLIEMTGGRFGNSEGVEWGDVATFIDEHSWSDQPGMHQLADLLRWLEHMASA